MNFSIIFNSLIKASKKGERAKILMLAYTKVEILTCCLIAVTDYNEELKRSQSFCIGLIK